MRHARSSSCFMCVSPNVQTHYLRLSGSNAFRPIWLLPRRKSGWGRIAISSITLYRREASSTSWQLPKKTHGCRNHGSIAATWLMSLPHSRDGTIRSARSSRRRTRLTNGPCLTAGRRRDGQSDELRFWETPWTTSPSSAARRGSRSTRKHSALTFGLPARRTKKPGQSLSYLYTCK